MLKISSIIFPSIPFNINAILITIFLQILPDLDILWSKNLSSHHESYFHAPIFWIAIFLVLIIISKITNIFASWIAYLFIIQVLSHLFFDYITARTAGIPIIYPFIKKEYSLYPLNKKHGNFKPFELKAQLNFLKPYLKNKILLLFEIIVSVLGVIVLII